MSISLTRKILSVCRGSGWSYLASKERCDARGKERGQKLASSKSALPVTMDCFGLTDIGRVRKCNEDQFLMADLTRSNVNCLTVSAPVEELDGEGMLKAGLLAVADGVGGNAGGQRASRLAVEGVVEFLHGNRTRLARDTEISGDQVLQDLKSALAWARQWVQREAEASPEHARMGTTLTMAYVAWPMAYVAHVGDSRLYLFRRHKLLQLTHDQTIARMLADAGLIAAECVERHPFRHTLGSVIGWNAGDFHPCVYKTCLGIGDQLLLCTDGLTGRVTNSQIADVLSSASSAEQACRELIAAANAAGGTDNTTVVVSRFRHHVVTRDAAADAAAVRAYALTAFAAA
jgi:protein phosphatase